MPIAVKIGEVCARYLIDQQSPTTRLNPERVLCSSDTWYPAVAYSHLLLAVVLSLSKVKDIKQNPVRKVAELYI